MPVELIGGAQTPEPQWRERLAGAQAPVLQKVTQ